MKEMGAQPPGPVMLQMEVVGSQHAPDGAWAGRTQAGRNSPVQSGCVPTVQSPVLRLQHAPGHGLITHGPVCHAPVHAFCATIVHALVAASQHAPVHGVGGCAAGPGCGGTPPDRPGDAARGRQRIAAHNGRARRRQAWAAEEDAGAQGLGRDGACAGRRIAARTGAWVERARAGVPHAGAGALRDHRARARGRVAARTNAGVGRGCRRARSPGNRPDRGCCTWTLWPRSTRRSGRSPEGTRRE